MCLGQISSVLDGFRLWHVVTTSLTVNADMMGFGDKERMESDVGRTNVFSEKHYAHERALVGPMIRRMHTVA